MAGPEIKPLVWTPDLVGRFWNIVEGISPQGVLSGKKSFEVIKPKE